MELLFIIIIPGICFIAYVRYLERNSLFYPSKIIEATPGDWGIGYEDVFFLTEDGLKLNGWFIKGEPRQKTVLFIHGNAGNIGDRRDKIDVFYRLGVNVFIIDFRGYGKSEGFPNEQGLYMDVRGAYDYLVNARKIAKENIVLYGVSLGGTFAVDLAVHREVASLIIDASFSSGPDMARIMFPFVPSFLIKTQLNSVQKVKKLNIPKLFLHSQEDEVVPFALGKKLFDAAAEPKQFVDLLGGHNDSHQVDRAKFINALKDFLGLN